MVLPELLMAAPPLTTVAPVGLALTYWLAKHMATATETALRFMLIASECIFLGISPCFDDFNATSFLVWSYIRMTPSLIYQTLSKVSMTHSGILLTGHYHTHTTLKCPNKSPALFCCACVAFGSLVLSPSIA